MTVRQPLLCRPTICPEGLHTTIQTAVKTAGFRIEIQTGAPVAASMTRSSVVNKWNDIATVMGSGSVPGGHEANRTVISIQWACLWRIFEIRL